VQSVDEQIVVVTLDLIDSFFMYRFDNTVLVHPALLVIEGFYKNLEVDTFLFCEICSKFITFVNGFSDEI